VSRPVHIRHVDQHDRDDWVRMRCALWPEDDAAGHGAEADAFFAGKLAEPLAVLIAVDAAGSAVGFAELSIRHYAEGCETNRVGYLEGWYVRPEARRQGIGRALVAAAERWASTQGCTEFGSDALLENDVSAAAHLALGFEEVVRIRCFKKVLAAGLAGDRT
jgi:aminoglycoside 6'-N-acetyltransferase I